MEQALRNDSLKWSVTGRILYPLSSSSELMLSAKRRFCIMDLNRNSRENILNSRISNENIAVPAWGKSWLIYGHYIIYSERSLYFFVCCHKVSSILLSMKISWRKDEFNQNINLQNKIIDFNAPGIFQKICGKPFFSITISTWTWLETSLLLNNSGLLFNVTFFTS